MRKRIFNLRNVVAVAACLAVIATFFSCGKESKDKQITAFSFTTPQAVGVINESAKTIAVSVPVGTDVTALVPTITVSEKATVSPSSGVKQDFTDPVTYTVTAEDGSTVEYIVTVTIGTGGGGGDASSLQTWTKVNLPAELTEDLNCVCFGNGKFVAGSDNANNGHNGKILVSSDNGKTWVINNNNVNMGGVRDIIYDGSRFVAIINGNIGYATNPSEAWTMVELPEYEDATYSPYCLAYGGGYYLAIGRQGVTAYATDVAGGWTRGKISPTSGSGESIYGLVYANGMFVAGGAKGKLAYASNPSGVWTTVDNHPFGDAYINDIIFDGTRFVFAASQNTLGYATSPDGTWTKKTSQSVTSYFEGIAFGSGMYVAVGTGIVYTSNPASDWVAVKNSPFNLMESANDVAFGNNTFVAVGVSSSNNGKIAYATVK